MKLCSFVCFSYKADLGYETFLYSNEVEIRRLLMFLVENLPRARQDAAGEDGGPTSTSSLRSSITHEIRRQLRLPWLPSECAKNHLIWDGNKKTGAYHYNGGFAKFRTRSLKKKDGSRCVGLQCPPDTLLCSLLELSTKLNQEIDVSNLTFTQSSVTSSSNNAREILKKAQEEAKIKKEDIKLASKLEALDIQTTTTPDTEHNIFKITESVLHGSEAFRKSESERGEKVQDEKVDDTEELVSQHEVAKEELTRTLEQLSQKHDDSKNKIENASKRLEELDKQLKTKEEKVDQLKDDYMLKKRTLQLVPQEKNAVEAMKEKVSTAQYENKNVKVCPFALRPLN